MFKVLASAATILGVALCAPVPTFAAEPRTAQAAQASGSSTVESARQQRLLNRREGAALRDFALAQPSDLEPKPDCSHLMHQIFTAAGLDYPYANSFDLYLGAPQFRRVKTPQPGDLIVWRGHVGLVVDPAARSFYSSLGSGIQNDEYDSRYWRRRGQPRFYRYLTAGSDKSPLLVARARPPQPSPAAPVEPVASDLVAESDAERSLPTDLEEEAATANSGAAPAENFQAPSNIQIVTVGVTPSRQEVTQALSELTNGSGAILRKPNFGQLSSSVVIFDQLQVEKVKFKRNKGWAEVRIKSRLELTQEKVNKRSRSEKLRWELRRNEQGWEALAPSNNRVYVPADVGVQVLAEKLAALSRDHKEEHDEQAKLAKLLNTMLNGE